MLVRKLQLLPLLPQLLVLRMLSILRLARVNMHNCVIRLLAPRPTQQNKS